MKRLFGTDGVRGIVNLELTPDVCLKLGMALCTVIKQKENKVKKDKLKILVGMDTRNSSQMIANAIMSGMQSMGCEVVFVGVVPTPAISYLIGKYNFNAGVMISASHNSYHSNGIKIFNSLGYKLCDELEEEIERVIEKCKYEHCDVSMIQEIKDGKQLIGEYIRYISSILNSNIRRMKIAFDLANGASVTTTPYIFDNDNIEAYYINHFPDGLNINKDCGATKLTSLQKYVLNNKIDLGIAFDGDCDRIIIVDSEGEVLDGDYILGYLSRYLNEMKEMKNKTIIGTIMTNLGLIKYLKSNGINFIPTKVGDRYVQEEMKKGDYSLGGEQSGHVIIKKYLQTGSGEITAILLINALNYYNEKSTEIGKIFTKYPQWIENIDCTMLEKMDFIQNKKVHELIEKEKKILGDKSRIIARLSGTENKIRIMVEKEDGANIEKYTKGLAMKIKNAIKNI